MIKVVNADQMAEIDRVSIEKYGLNADLLLEQAGLRLADIIDRICTENGIRKIAFFVGSGHNGGDGLVIARFLNERYHQNIFIFSRGKSSAWLAKEKILKNFGISITEITAGKPFGGEIAGKAECIIDCLSGTGLKSAPRPDLAEIINAVNSSPAFKISIDIPSGLFRNFDGTSPAVNSDMTLYINLPKISFFTEAGRKHCGTLVRTEIGFPPAEINSAQPSAVLVDETSISEFYSENDAADYKNRKGHAVFFAGSTGTSGAAILASTAAEKSGCGLVSLFTSASAYAVIAPAMPSVMCRPDDKYSFPVLKNFSSFCAGPGWGKGEKQDKISADLIKSGIPGIIDADAVEFFAGYLSENNAEKINYIFTPHPGEFKRIYKKVFNMEPGADTVSELVKTAEKLNSVIVYKNSFTITAFPGAAPFIVDGMFPALAVAGSGDVLSGIIAGFLARGFKCRDAAVCAVLFHLKAAKALYNKTGVFNSEQLSKSIGMITAEYEKK